MLALLGEAEGAEQRETAALLLLLLEANPGNKRTLARSPRSALLPLLRLLARCADDSGGYLRVHLLRAAATLCEYTISGSEALLLFRLAAAPGALLPPARPPLPRPPPPPPVEGESNAARAAREAACAVGAREDGTAWGVTRAQGAEGAHAG